MSISDYLEERFLNCLGNAAASDPRVATVYCSLHTADPGETGASEVAGGSYARQAVSWNAASNPGGTKTNSGALNFTLMPVATVTHAALWDAVSAGNCLWSGTATNRTLALNDTYQVAAGALTVTLA